MGWGAMKGIRLIGAVLLLTLVGCGVEWFPEFKRQPTDPDPFTFTPNTNASPGATVTSNPITVTGLTADTAPVSVSGTTTTSTYSINGGTATSTPGTVKNNDTVTVSHTASTTVNGQVSTTLTIGQVSGTFTSTTGQSTTNGGFNVVNTTTSGAFSHAEILNIPSGTYNVSISSNGKFSFDNFATVFTSTSPPKQQAIVSGVTPIYLMNLAPNVTTTITFTNSQNTIQSFYTTTMP